MHRIAGLMLSPSKTHLFRKEVVYLGHLADDFYRTCKAEFLKLPFNIICILSTTSSYHSFQYPHNIFPNILYHKILLTFFPKPLLRLLCLSFIISLFKVLPLRFPYDFLIPPFSYSTIYNLHTSLCNPCTSLINLHMPKGSLHIHNIIFILV